MGDHGALWYGSQLSIKEARELLGKQYNATSIQIAIPVLAGAMWLIQHPDQGLLEPEDLDHDFVMGICKPYLGPWWRWRASGLRCWAAASSIPSQASTAATPGSSRTSA